MVRVGWVRAPGVSEDAADEPVGAGDDPVGGGVVGVDDQVGQPAVVAAEGERVSVEEDDAGYVVGVRESGCRDHAGSERVADEYGTMEVEALLEAPEQVEPVRHGVRAVALAVPEGWQVECEDAVASLRKERTNFMPDPRRLGRAAE